MMFYVVVLCYVLCFVFLFVLTESVVISKTLFKSNYLYIYYFIIILFFFTEVPLCTPARFYPAERGRQHHQIVPHWVRRLLVMWERGKVTFYVIHQFPFYESYTLCIRYNLPNITYELYMIYVRR